MAVRSACLHLAGGRRGPARCGAAPRASGAARRRGQGGREPRGRALRVPVLLPLCQPKCRRTAVSCHSRARSPRHPGRAARPGTAPEGVPEVPLPVPPPALGSDNRCRRGCRVEVVSLSQPLSPTGLHSGLPADRSRAVPPPHFTSSRVAAVLHRSVQCRDLPDTESVIQQKEPPLFG